MLVFPKVELFSYLPHLRRGKSGCRLSVNSLKPIIGSFLSDGEKKTLSLPACPEALNRAWALKLLAVTSKVLQLEALAGCQSQLVSVSSTFGGSDRRINTVVSALADGRLRPEAVRRRLTALNRYRNRRPLTMLPKDTTRLHRDPVPSWDLVGELLSQGAICFGSTFTFRFLWKVIRVGTRTIKKNSPIFFSSSWTLRKKSQPRE